MTYRRDLMNDAAFRHVCEKLHNHPHFNSAIIRHNIYTMDEDELQHALDYDTPDDMAERFLAQSDT